MGLFKKKNNQNDNQPYQRDTMNLKGLSKVELLEIIRTQKSENDEMQLAHGKEIADCKAAHQTEMTALQESRTAELESVAAEYEEKISELQSGLEKNNEILRKQVVDLESQNTILEQKIEEYKNKPSECGSVAEQAFKVNCVMEVAQKAADEYVQNIKKMHEEMSAEYSKYEIAAQAKADNILAEATAQAEQIKRSAKSETEDIWQSLQSRFDTYCADRKAGLTESSKVTPFARESV